MATDFKLLDDPYDMEKVNGDFAIVSDREEVLQAVTIRLAKIRGEWEYDFTSGVPWLDAMFDINYPQVKKDAHIKNTILQTPNVLSVENATFTLKASNHSGTIKYNATTVFGAIQGELTI